MITEQGYFPEAKKYEKEFTSSLSSEKLCEYTMQTSSNDIGKHYRALYDYCKWLEEQVGKGGIK